MGTTIKGQAEFINKLKRLSVMRQNFTRIAGRDAIAFFKDRFRAQNWIDNRTEPWKRRKNRSKKQKGRNVLIKTGALRRSIRVTRTAQTKVWVGSDSKYAKAHNEGYRGTQRVSSYKRGKYKSKRVGTGSFSIKSKKERQKKVTEHVGDTTVKAHTRRVNLPKRQFIGQSRYLMDKIQRQLTADVAKILK